MAQGVELIMQTEQEHENGWVRRPYVRKNDMAMEMFGKQLKDLTDEELELLDEEIDRLRSKFMADGGRVLKQTGGISESRLLPPGLLKLHKKHF